MTIKHLVISGGGPLGLRYLGALEKLEQDCFWQIDSIESIYGTSIGAIVGAFICLKYKWETLNKYIIERPWHDAFKVTAKQIFDSYYNKGLFDKKMAEIIFKPLLQAKDLSLNITLQEFYEYSKIDLHIFTFELNKFETVELSHKTHPELNLLQALTMSAALPGIFMPIIIDNCCYVDGGVMCNYPLNYCLRDHDNKDEILGIKISYNNETDSFKNVQITQDTSLLEYVICLTLNAMNFIRDTVKIEHIENTVKCFITDNPLTLDFMQESISNQDLRRQWIKQGEEDAIQFTKELCSKIAP
jgi:predicted acylesterase/phospholipase RssA